MSTAIRKTNPLGTATPKKTCLLKLAQLYLNHEPQSERPSGRPCRPELYINCDQQSGSVSGEAVYQQRGILTAINKAKAYLAQHPLRKLRSATRHHGVARLHISPKPKNLSEKTSGRHSRVDQNVRSAERKLIHGLTVYEQQGIPTATSEAKAYLAQLCINSNQQSQLLRHLR